MQLLSVTTKIKLHQLYLKWPRLFSWLCADFRGRDLSDFCFTEIDFRGADFRDCNLSGAQFVDCDLRYGQFKGANLAGATFKRCGMNYKNGYGALFFDNELRYFGSYSTGIGYVKPRIFPPEDFVGYKVAVADDDKPVIIKLSIPADVRSIVYEGDKCRAEKVFVLDIYRIDDSEVKYSEANSCIYTHSFSYHVGEYATAMDWNNQPLAECAAGIHFFLTEAEAVEYARDMGFID